MLNLYGLIFSFCLTSLLLLVILGEMGGALIMFKWVLLLLLLLLLLLTCHAVYPFADIKTTKNWIY